MNQATRTPRWAAIRNELRSKREAWASIRKMERELGDCSPAQATELRAIVDRYDGPDAELVRNIINRRIA